jgi:hypothetical protein
MAVPTAQLPSRPLTATQGFPRKEDAGGVVKIEATVEGTPPGAAPPAAGADVDVSAEMAPSPGAVT